MTLLRCLCLALVSTLVLAAPARGDGLVQLRLEGRLTQAHLVEVEIGTVAVPDGVVLHVHLAERTTGAELAELVASRLDRSGAKAKVSTPENGCASLWIDEATYVHLRLGGGLQGTIACTEGAPETLKIVDESAIAGESIVRVNASAALVIGGKAPIRSRLSLNVPLKGETSAADAASAIWEAAKEEWVSDRPGTDAWHPIKPRKGGVLVGFSVSVAGAADRRVEVVL